MVCKVRCHKFDSSILKVVNLKREMVMPLPHKPMDGSDGRVELLAVPSPVMIMNVHVITVSFIPGSEIALSWSPMRLEI